MPSLGYKLGAFRWVDMSQYPTPVANPVKKIEEIKNEIGFGEIQRELFPWLMARVRWFEILRYPASKTTDIKRQFKKLAQTSKRYRGVSTRSNDYDTARLRLLKCSKQKILTKKDLFRGDRNAIFIKDNFNLNDPDMEKTVGTLADELFEVIAKSRAAPELLLRAVLVCIFLRVMFGVSLADEDGESAGLRVELSEENLEFYRVIISTIERKKKTLIRSVYGMYYKQFKKALESKRGGPPFAKYVPKDEARRRILSDMKLIRFMNLYFRDIQYKVTKVDRLKKIRAKAK